MTHISAILNFVPDYTAWKEAAQWLQEARKQVMQIDAEKIVQSRALEWKDIEQEKQLPFGLYPSNHWRKFALATFVADLVSYSNAVDQVSFERLLYVMHLFPQGFRTWWVELPNRAWLPVGYTGWFPMFDTAYELFKKNPEGIKDRTVVPNVTENKNQKYLYLFNYSVAPNLRKSPLSNMLMRAFVQDIEKQEAKGLACITVSEDGVRIATRFGMRQTGILCLEGALEGIYTSL